jgi:integrase
MPLNQIGNGDIKRFIAGLQEKENLEARRINYVIGRLRSIFAAAAARHEFETPMKGIKSLRAPKTEIDPFTPEEVRHICAAATGQDRAFITLLLHTGLRPSEAMALSWSDIDFDRQFLIVRRNLTRFGFGLPKTEGSELRTVDLDTDVLVELRHQRERTGVMAGGTGLVFLADQGYTSRAERAEHYRIHPKTGAKVLVHAFSQRIVVPRGRRTGGAQSPLNLANFRARNWGRILKAAGVRPRPIYQCRHTFATILLDLGEAPRYVADQLGHTSLAMVIRHYARWTRKPGRLIARGIAQAVDSSMPNPCQVGGKRGANGRTGGQSAT